VGILADAEPHPHRDVNLPSSASSRVTDPF
jgi:hypothetical protein